MMWAALLLVALSVWALFAGSNLDQITAKSADSGDDAALYTQIVDRMDAGSTYYEAAVTTQYELGYPTQPATTVRPPTLAHLTALAGPGGIIVLHTVLALGVFLLAIPAFEAVSRSKVEWLGLTATFSVSLIVVALPVSTPMHETWAVMLLLAATFVHAPGRYRLSILLALMACVFRELALPYLAAMSVVALCRSRVAEAMWWTVGIVGYLGAYAVHIVLVDAAVTPALNRSSPGWVTFGGWARVADYIQATSVLVMLPGAVGVVILGLALFGWVSRSHHLATSITAAILAFAIPFMVLGRVNTAYWGFLLVPFVLPGVVVCLATLIRHGRMRTTLTT